MITTLLLQSSRREEGETAELGHVLWSVSYNLDFELVNPKMIHQSEALNPAWGYSYAGFNALEPGFVEFTTP